MRKWYSRSNKILKQASILSESSFNYSPCCFFVSIPSLLQLQFRCFHLLVLGRDKSTGRKTLLPKMNLSGFTWWRLGSQTVCATPSPTSITSPVPARSSSCSLEKILKRAASEPVSNASFCLYIVLLNHHRALILSPRCIPPSGSGCCWFRTAGASPSPPPAVHWVHRMHYSLHAIPRSLST